MAAQICITCKHKNSGCYCSPNSCCTEYEEEQKITIGMLEDMEESMIKAAIQGGLKSRDLLDLLTEKGLMGVYNLGMEHMYDYLKE